VALLPLRVLFPVDTGSSVVVVEYEAAVEGGSGVVGCCVTTPTVKKSGTTLGA